MTQQTIRKDGRGEQRHIQKTIACGLRLIVRLVVSIMDYHIPFQPRGDRAWQTHWTPT